MNIKINNLKDFKSSKWSGGETIQLAISPENLSVKDDFIWRISSATVEKGDSNFTIFKGYKRFLILLDGELAIKHENKESILLKKLKPYYFSGFLKIESKSEMDISDFNVIWKEEIGDLNINLYSGSENKKVFQKKIFIYCVEDFTKLKVNDLILIAKKDDFIMLEDNKNIEVLFDKKLIIGEIK
ncbi:MAG: HutD family protein [Fusobacteriaceae bacterium]